MIDASLMAWLALATLVTITPGPDTLLVVGHSMKSGARAGLAASAGIIAGFFWYGALGYFGFMAVLAATPWLYNGVKIGGALYLIFIGVQMLLGALKPATIATAPALGAPFRQGLLSNTLNPKIALFYLAALPHFIGAGPDAPGRALLLIGLHYLMGAVWLTGLALVSARAGGTARRSAAFRWIEGAIGAALIGLGARLLFDRRGN